MNKQTSFPHTVRPEPAKGCLKVGGVSILLATLSACTALSPKNTVHPAFYALVGTPTTVTTPSTAPSQTALPTLLINPSSAASGFDSPRIIYQREEFKLEYFADSEWIDPPARMLGPVLVDAIARTGAFQAVVLTHGAATGEARLDTEIVRLVQDFRTQPSQVRFTLRATLVDEKTRRVLGWQEFNSNITASTEDAYGGVQAANLAVQKVSLELAAFCVKTMAEKLKAP